MSGQAALYSNIFGLVVDRNIDVVVESGPLQKYINKYIQIVLPYKKHETLGLVLDILERIKDPLGKKKNVKNVFVAYC